MVFRISSVSKESVCSAGDLGLTPGLGTSPGKENDNLGELISLWLQYKFQGD